MKEFKILEFEIDKNNYCVNIENIEEILNYVKTTPVPQSNENVEGVTMPRDKLITVVDLAKVLKLKSSEDITKDMFVVLALNKNTSEGNTEVKVALHVHKVVQIIDVDESFIVDSSQIFKNKEELGYTKGVLNFNDRLIVILDFEKILKDTGLI